MSWQPNRLPAGSGARLAGAAIDRGRPLSFRLDGRLIHGFAGDTVFSAALASGLTGAGWRHGAPLALDEGFAPAVLLESGRGDPARALPMERTPALDGLRLVTLAAARRPRVVQILARAGGPLGARAARHALRLDGDGAPRPWHALPAGQRLAADLVVIGGGLAGLGAALAAGRSGVRVVLLERRLSLGGAAAFFGAAGDGEAPEAAAARLAAALAGLPNVTIFTAAEAFALGAGEVRVSQVRLEQGGPVSAGLAIEAPRAVVATGLVERLPVFAGNRCPGVVGALAAFERAERFGVWIGGRALVATSVSEGYRLATQTRDAGIAIERIVDTRASPQSRFIEFAKAYGMPMRRAARPVLARQVPGGRLAVRITGDGEAAGQAQQDFVVDQLVVAGGWQPDLGLWHMAGGASRWDAATGRLAAEGAVSGLALAGAAAGYRNAAATIASGEAAVAALFGRAPPCIDDTQIDPMFETPDGPLAVAPAGAGNSGDAYLAAGASLARRPARPRRSWPGWLARHAAGWDPASATRPLGVAEIAAAVELGLLSPDDAAIVAQERGEAPGSLANAVALRPPAATGQSAEGVPPAWLAGRFGAAPAVWLVEPDDGRRLSVGCLIHADADEADPLRAIGVIFAPAPGGAAGGLGLLEGSWPVDRGVLVRDISGPVAARLGATPPAPTPPGARPAPPHLDAATEPAPVAAGALPSG